MRLLHPRALFVGLSILCAERFGLLEPCDLVSEQAHRDLRRGAADLRGGEERGYGKVERLLARVRSSGTGLVGKEQRCPGQSGGVGGVVGQRRLRRLVEHSADGPDGILALDLHTRCVMPAGSVTA